MPNGWEPLPMRRPYRVMAVGRATTAFFAAPDEEKETKVFPPFTQMVRGGGAGGAPPRLGPHREPWAWTLIFEVDDLDVAAALVQAVREPVDGVRLDRYLELEVRVGRPFWAREE